MRVTHLQGSVCQVRHCKWFQIQTFRTVTARRTLSHSLTNVERVLQLEKSQMISVLMTLASIPQMKLILTLMRCVPQCKSKLKRKRKEKSVKWRQSRRRKLQQKAKKFSKTRKRSKKKLRNNHNKSWKTILNRKKIKIRRKILKTNNRKKISLNRKHQNNKWKKRRRMQTINSKYNCPKSHLLRKRRRIREQNRICKLYCTLFRKT